MNNQRPLSGSSEIETEAEIVNFLCEGSGKEASDFWKIRRTDGQAKRVVVEGDGVSMGSLVFDHEMAGEKGNFAEEGPLLGR